MEAQNLGQRVKRIRRKLGETQTNFAARFGVDQSTVSKWERNDQIPESYNLDLLSEIEAGISLDDEAGEMSDTVVNPLFTLVPVVGEIGAGAAVYPVEGDTTTRTTGYVRAARGFGAVEALRVRGDSMWPVYRDGDWVFVENRESSFPLERDKEYILDLADGRRLLKAVEPSRDGRYNLISYNAPPERDVEIVRAHKVRYVRKA
jgi:phage repressor protein C with HTH and peptisase S24 domain